MLNYPLSFKAVSNKLLRLGFSVVSQKGSHVKFIKYTDKGIITTIVPNHKEITIGTLKSILKQAFLSDDEFNQA